MPRLLASAVLINLLLLVPLWLRFGEPGSRLIALEAVILALLPALLPGSARLAWLRWSIVVAVMLVLVIGLGDAATHLAFGRSLNLYLDIPLVRSVFHLLEGNLGAVIAVLVTLVGALLLVAIAWLLAYLLKSTQGILRARPAMVIGAGLLMASGLLVAAELKHSRLLPQARTPLLDTLHFQAERLLETRRAHREFAERLVASPSPARSLPGLVGRDVVLLFVESYGVSAVVDDRYADVVVPRLQEMGERLQAAGLSMASGTLEAPIRGGQSWLAHASTLSGLWIDNQLWYQLMLASERDTLVDDFRATGHRTLAVMPAITLAWPEGEAYDFDEIHAASDIDYAGPPLNWVTMPDQFTLHHFEQRIRQPTEVPLFAQIALISSHAPWTPIIPVLDDWDEVGDGSVYSRWEDAGDPPDELWQDLERIRDHYALSVDYALHASLRWAEDFVDEDTLLILMGDHQAAPLITGDDASGAVPVHVISGDPRLLAPFLDRGFVDGMLPPDTGKSPGMDQFRRWLHEDFGS
ncbi:alkaline phosphatase [Halomonas sp.]|uniref:alkaline phosphatase n=1 Tax=Halomonas sp. TaxID=1486246 RepID=UPI0035697821